MARDFDVFLSYSRRDSEAAQQLASALSAEGIRVWVDSESLTAGSNWVTEIENAITSSTVIVSLVSQSSLASASVMGELAKAELLGKLITLVAVEPIDGGALPFNIAQYQILDLSNSSAPDRWQQAAKQIAATVRTAPAAKPTVVEEIATAELAETIAAEKRGQPVVADPSPDSVFLVHGHDEAMLRDVEAYVSSLGVRAIVMKDVGDQSMSLLQKFLRISDEAHFAIVLVSGDDLGGERLKVQRWAIGKWALKLRARQNVVLELGYFFGLLGWERVFVLQHNKRSEFRDFEMPSDLNGVPFVSFDKSGRWREAVRNRLIEHKFQLLV